MIDHYETIRVHTDGTAIPISLTVSPIRDLSGSVVGASKIPRDISDRRRIEEERARLPAQEEAARQDAERASRVKDEFLATLDGDAAVRALEIVDRDSSRSRKRIVGIIRTGKSRVAIPAT